MKAFYTLLFASSVLMTSCVSQKKYAELQAEVNRLKAEAPAAKAKSDVEANMIEDLQNQVNQMQMELKTQLANAQEMQKMMEAGKIPPPTPEQMRVYEMQHMQDMEKHMGPGGMDDPMAMQENELKMEFQRTAFENRLATEALKNVLSGYSEKQIQFSNDGGRTVMGIASKELFEAGSTDLSEMGKGLVAQIAVSLKGQKPLYYRVIAVNDKATSANLKQGGARAAAIYDQLAKEAGNVRLPRSVGASACDNAALNTNFSCERVEFIFEQNYPAVMGKVEETLAQ